MDPNTTAVIVAIGEIRDRPDDWHESLEPTALMAAAARQADADGGCGWLAAVDSLDVVHQKSWRYRDTAGAVAAALDIQPARSEYGHYGGETPVAMIDAAARRIEAGTSRVALIVSGEAQYAATKARREGLDLGWTPLAEREEHAFDPSGVIDPLAAAQGVLTPAQVYPLFDTAWTATKGLTQAQGVAASAAVWARYAEAARANPFAWQQDPPGEQAIGDPGNGNRWICWPYTRAMVANPEVNQGAAVIVTNLAEARRRGVANDRMVYVGGGAHASEPRNWLLRDRFDRSGAQAAVLAAMGGPFDLAELYSCFPVVPKMAGDTLGEAILDRPTVAGGLSFFGGPLNSYMLHAATAMVRALRGGQGERGLLYGQGEYLTKHHALALGREPEGAGPGNVQRIAEAARGPVPDLRSDATGPATIEAHTVVFGRDGTPQFGAVVARGIDGWRTLARTEDGDTIARLIDPGPGPVGSAGLVKQGDGRPVWRFI